MALILSGMNVAEIRSLAGRLQRHADTLENSARAVDRLVQLAHRNWQGNDIAEFDDRWSGTLRQVAENAARDLRNLGEDARRNADDQERTSNDLEGDAGGGVTANVGNPAGAPPAPSPAPGGGGGGWGPAPFGWARDGFDWVGDRVEDGVEWTRDAGEWVGDRASEAWNWGKETAGDAWNWGKDTAGDAWGWLQDRRQDVANFVTPRVEAGWAGLQRHAEARATEGQLLKDLLSGHPPQLTEVFASQILIAGTGAGVFANVIGGRDYKLLDPGTPGAGEQRQLTGDPRFRPINDLNSLTNATMSAYDADGVRVDKLAYTRPDGGTDYRYIVSVPGTQGEIGQLSGWSDNANARNWAANLWAMTNKGDATNAQAVKMALEKAGVPEGANVLLTGHSQGGIIAGNLAADHEFTRKYNVDGVIAYGAPVECADLHGNSAPVLSFAHDNSVRPQIVMDPNTGRPSLRITGQIGDPVPQLDLSGASVYPFAQRGDITEIDLPPRGNDFLNMRANHEQSGYIQDVQNLSPENRAAVDRYIRDNGLDVYFQGRTESTVAVETKG